MQQKSPTSLSEGLSPLEIKNKEFSRSVWGYAPQEVVEFLDQTAKAWEKVQKQEKALIEEIRSLNQELAIWKNKEAEFDQLREKAKEDARKVREAALEEAEKGFVEAQQRADEIRVKTEQWLETVIREVEETQRRKNSFVTAFRSALDQHYAILKTDQEPEGSLEARLSHFLNEQLKESEKSLEMDPRLS